MNCLDGAIWDQTALEKERERERERDKERERESAKFNGTIHTLGDTRDQSLSPVTPKQTFLCDVKPWSSP